jgi:alkylhydroperoxidase family enzyme
VRELREVVAHTPPDARLAGYLEKVRLRAYEITDADVRALEDAGVTEDEIFEQTVAVAISEGLRRLDAAEKVIG